MDYKDKQIDKNKNFHCSFVHAWDGLKIAFLEEKNIQRHCVIALIVIALGFFFHCSGKEWLWLWVAIFTVIILEIINTLVENIVDLVVGHQYHPLAKKIKDLAAGMVLVGALIAAIIGVMILGPHVLSWLT